MRYELSVDMAEILMQLKNFSSLQTEIGKDSLEGLTVIGDKLTELFLGGDSYEGNLFVGVLQLFVTCPNLEYLSILEFVGKVDFKVPLVPQNLKLKKLVLSGSFFHARGFLPLIFRAPLLEEVKMNSVFISKQDLQTFVAYLSVGIIFNNLTSIKIKARCAQVCRRIPSALKPGTPQAKDLLLAMEDFGKNVVAFCPKLRIANFDFSNLSVSGNKNIVNNDTENPGSAAPFVALVKMI